MGAWDVLAFDNDEANDWAYQLEDANDLASVESALGAVEAAGSEYLEAPAASEALAACEVIARLRGRPGYTNAYTEKVDDWVSAHRIEPDPKLIARADRAIDRILGDASELRELWDDSDHAGEWRAAVSYPRKRVTG